MKIDILIVGVGGQGIMLASNILSRAALDENLDFKKAETHGMAQRGGSVMTHVRMSDEEVHSPLIPKGRVDLLLGFEPLEALRYLDYLDEGSEVVVNENPIKIPNYPSLDEILNELRSHNAVTVDALSLAREAGNLLTQNVALIGAASEHLPLRDGVLKRAVKETVKRAENENLKAFDLGKNI